eukprot:9790-Heterococcus_DN1.PRE.1
MQSQYKTGARQKAVRNFLLQERYLNTAKLIGRSHVAAAASTATFTATMHMIQLLLPYSRTVLQLLAPCEFLTAGADAKCSACSANYAICCNNSELTCIFLRKNMRALLVYNLNAQQIQS